MRHRFLPGFLRRRSATALSRSSVLGVALLVALTPELAQATQLPFPQQSSHPGAAHSLAAGLSHTTDASSTKAGGGNGHAAGQGKGELGKPVTHQKDVKPGPSGKASAPISNAGTSPSGQPDATSFDPQRSSRRKDVGDDRSVVFANPDGTNTVHAYEGRVQFKDASGGWTPIDDTLKADGSGRLHQSADSLSTAFAPTASDPALMSLATDATHQVTFSMAGAAASSAAVSGDTAVYPNVATATDLSLKATPEGTKETVVLHDASAPTSWIFPFSAQGLTASQDAATGDIVFADASGKQVVRVPHGTMTDSNVDPKSHDPAWSDGVTYALTTYQGSAALQVTVDSAWLKDPARKFPVYVDPTNLVSSSSTYVETTDNTGNNAHDSVLKVGTYDNNVHKAVSYLAFSNLHSTFQNDWVRGAWLHLYNVWSSYCTPENVYVNSMTGSWNVDTISSTANGYPGAATGFIVGQQAFTGGSGCSSGPVWQRVGLNSGYFDNYAHGSTFYGLALTADLGTTTSWKQFASVASNANAPYLEIDYSPYGVKWTSTPTWSTVPTATTDGVLQVPLENWGNTTWTPTNSYQLRYTLTNANTGAVLASANTSMPGNVAPQQSTTVPVTVAHQAAGIPLKLTLDMVAPGGITFSSWNAPTEYFNYTGANIAPQIDGMAPASNTTQPSLTPTLWAAGHDPDNYPSGLQYQFWVCPASGSGCTASGLQAAGQNAWTVPAGTLKWGQSYYWYVQDYDGSAYSAPSAPAWFNTAVGQPVITSHLAQNSNAEGFDPESGNYTTAATDLTVAGSGLPLQVQRTYNSLDPRTNGAFGASWSSVFDMQAVLDNDGTGNVTVTYPNGQQVRFGRNGDGTFTPPPGRFATLTANGSTGYTLVDKDGTTYTFAAGAVQNVLPIASIADHAGHAETFTYANGQLSTSTNVVSGRSLHFTWSKPTGASYQHVSTVFTDPVAGTDQTTDITATYSYNGDQLAKQCLPSQQTACTTYDNATGSHNRSVVMDANPKSFWRLDDPAGSTSAASQVLANEGSDAASPVSATFGAAGVNANSTSASFNGTSNFVQLPNGQVEGGTFLTLQMWFKTNLPACAPTDNICQTHRPVEPLFSTAHNAAGSANPGSGAMPVLYVGTDGHLYGHFWDTTVNGMSSSANVDDGQWHQVTLTAAGTSQVLYLDGQQVSTESDQLMNIDPYDVVGAAVFNANGWPAGPVVNAGQLNWTYFAGQIADVAFYDKPLSPGQISGQYTAATTPAALLTGMTLPSGKTAATANYDLHAERVTSVTDLDGGTYKVGAPTVSGTSAVYRSAVLGGSPAGYWRLGDQPGAAQAFDELDNDGAAAAYNNVTLGTSSPFGDTTGATFDGSTSSVQIPNTVAPTSGAGAVSTWFKTTGSGMILNYQTVPLGTANPTGQMWATVYVGTDGILRGGFYTASGSEIMPSPSPVNDGKWHHVVLSGAGTSQALYLDGKQINQATTSTPITTVAQPYAYLGAGTTGSSWPGLPNLTDVHFNGSIADFAFYQHQISAVQVGALWGAAQTASGAAPTTKVEVIDPNGNPLDYNYDPYNGGRLITSSDAAAKATSYGYDTGGFLNTVTDPDGNITTTGHDVRGNVVSRTTCQNVLASKCATAYYTYWPDDTSTSLRPDPRNDQMTTSRDGRSADATDSTYATVYNYDANGDLTTTTTPSVAGSRSGRTSTTVYTAGTEAAADSGTVPAGLVASATTPGGAKTVYTYFHNGDVASITDPAGLVTDYTYDGLGRVLAKKAVSDTYPQGLTTSYSYDAAGHVLTETDPAVTDKVTGKAHTKVTTTGYDADGEALTVAVADSTGGDATRTTTSTYDASDRLASVTDPTGAVTSSGYDAFGDKTKQVDASGTETDYAYDPRGKLTTVTLHNYNGDPANPSPATDLVQSSRAYDPAGRLATVTDSLGRTTSYTYFDDGHLATVTVSPTTAGTDGTVTDSRGYDLAGNLISESKGDGQASSVYTVDAANRDVVVADQYSTDSSGNPLYRTTTTTFDPDDHPVSVSKTQQGSATVETVDYTYDPMGRKTTQTVHDPTKVQSSSAGLAGSWPMADATTTAAADSSATPAMRAPIQVPMDGRVYAASAAQSWTSAAVRLVFQTDGNLVAYRTSDGVAIWNSATAGHTNATLALQTDGNLVIYSAASGGTSLWATATNNNPGDMLQLADNGDFTVTNTNGTRLWSAGTAQTGYNQPGTLHGGVSWSADHGGSAAFDGSSGSVSTAGPAVNTAGSFTVSAWIKPNATGGVAVSQAGANASGFILYPDTTLRSWAFGAGTQDSGWNYDEATGSVPALGAWSHVTGVYDAAAGKIYLYVNGVQVGSANHTKTFNAVRGLMMGSYQNNGALSSPFNGSLSGVRVYKRALSAAEISALYTGPASAGPGQNGLAGAWNLGDGKVSSAADTSGGNNSGAVNGGVSFSADHNGSAVFDGTGNIATPSTVVDTSQSYSLSAWVKLADTNADHFVVSEAGTNYTAGYIGYNKGLNAWIMDTSTGDTNPTFTWAQSAAGSVAVGTWTHLVGTYDVSSHTERLYVNGALAGTSTNTSPWKATTPLVIGDTSALQQGGPFTGSLSGVQAYSRALSAADVSTLYSGGSLVTGPTNVLKTTWALDKRGLPTSTTDPRGNAPGATAAAYTTGLTYDEAGNLVVTTSPTVNAETGGGAATAVHPVTTYGYDTFGEHTSTQDADGNITATGFDGDGRVTAITRPNYTAPGASTAITATAAVEYNSMGEPITQTDPLGNKSSYTYDQMGDLATRTDPAANGTGTGGVWHRTYDTDGEVVSSTDPTGATVQAGYDYLGRTTTTTQVVRQPATTNDTTTYSYDSLGDVAKVVSPTGVTTTAFYDNLGEQTYATDGAGNVTTHGYDLDGRTAWVHNPDGTMKSEGYDLAGRNTWSSDVGTNGSNLRTTYKWYDLAGNLTATTDPLGVTTSYGYDALNHLVWQSEPVASGKSIGTTYGYDAAGNRTRYTDGNGGNWIATYNTWNKPESEIDPATAAYPNAVDRTYSVGYDAAGNPVTVTEPGGVTRTRTFDNLGRLTKEAGSGAAAATAERDLGYDAAGRLTSASAPGGTDSFTWNDRGELVSTAGPSGTSSFAYNTAGQMTGRTDAAGTTTYGYDTAGRLSTLADPLTGSTATYSYTNMDQVSSVGYGTGNDTRTYSYDGLHRLTGDALTTSTGSTVASITYGYDLDNRETSKTTTGFTAAGSNSYTYDQAGRLTSWNNGAATTNYGYDNAGNRTQIGNQTLTYDARDRLQSDGTNTYGYTARGTVASKTPIAGGSTAESITSDAFDRTVTDSTGALSYTYDGLDRLVGHGTANTAYSGVGGTIASDGFTAYTYDPSGALAAYKTSAGASLAYTDLHGDLVGGYAANGTALGYSKAYDPLGNVISKVNGNVNLGYQGGWTDPSTGKLSTASRWYDPSNGQFTSRDTVDNSPSPASADANRYGYANGNPLTVADPTGHAGEDEPGVTEVDGSAMDEIVGRALADWDPFAGEIAQFMADIESYELKMGATSDLAAEIANDDAEELHYISVSDKKAANDDVKGMGLATQRAWYWYDKGIQDRKSIGVDTSTDPCDRGVNTAQCRASMNQRSSNNGKSGGNGRTGSDIPEGRGTTSSSSNSTNHTTGRGGSPTPKKWTPPPPPPPPTPAQLARIPAQRPGPSRLGDGSGVDHSVQKTVYVATPSNVATAGGGEQSSFVPSDAAPESDAAGIGQGGSGGYGDNTGKTAFDDPEDGSSGLPRGIRYERYLQNQLGAGDGFTAVKRDFDGKLVGDGGKELWYEAKSGNFWNDPKRIQSFMNKAGEQLREATGAGADFMVISENSIPEQVTNWLDKKGIPWMIYPWGP